MKRERVLTLAVIALLLLNFGVLSSLFLRDRPHPPRHGGPMGNRPLDRHIVEELNLDETQRAQFEALKHEHHTAMLALDQAYRQALEAYFLLLNKENNPLVEKDSLEQKLGTLQRKKAAVTFAHFNQLKALCRPEQKARFANLVPELLEVLLPGQKKFPPPEGIPPR